MANKIVCTICPLSCEVILEIGAKGEIVNLRGNRCLRGKTYVEKEYTAPERTLTTIVKARGGLHPLLPVRTSAPIPKEKVQAGMVATAAIVVDAPVVMGDVIIKDFLGLGVDLIATRDL